MVSSFGSFESAIGEMSGTKFAQETGCCHLLSDSQSKALLFLSPDVRPEDRIRGFQ